MNQRRSRQPVDAVAPRASASTHLVGLWFVCAALAFLLCLYSFSATLVDGVFIPADHDSFYHARRIIGALEHPFALLQFDPHIHAPEGSWITWPWAYDTMMAVLGGWLVALTGVEQPMAVLAFIAPAWVFGNAALLVAAGRRLGLGLPLLGLSLLSFALSPLTRILHRVGMIDHHFVELSFVLAVLWCGLRWFGDLGRVRAAAGCALVLGAAPAFHNGLFILQLPILVSLFVVWTCGRELPRAAARTFGAVLTLSTGIFLLPSEPFLNGDFSFYLHSAFHLYIAVSSALVVVALAYLDRGARSLAILGLGAALLAVPILGQIGEGGSFLRGEIIKYDAIVETRSMLRLFLDGGFSALDKVYSGLVWLLPLTLAALSWQLRTHRDNASLFFLVMCAFGVLLLVLQFRLQYFGSFVMYLGWCVVVQRWIDAEPRRARGLGAAVLLIFAVAHIEPLRALEEEFPIGNDMQYTVTRDVYPILGEACAAAPGVVLAEHGDGHYITYHTNCSVIANNFILTARHQRKVEELDALLRASLEEALQRAPYVRYVFVRRADNVLAPASCHPGCRENAGLREELLGDAGLRSPRLELLFEKVIWRGEVEEPLARLFAVRSPADRR